MFTAPATPPCRLPERKATVRIRLGARSGAPGAEEPVLSSEERPTYPIQLRLEGAVVLVVGAGQVAWRKVRRLLEAGARVTVVAPEALPELAGRAAESGGRLDWRRRRYRAGEAADPAAGYALVFAATAEAALNAQVAAEATAAGRPVNVTDDPVASTFYLPAQIRRGALQLNIATDGGAPFLARRLRESWESWLGPEWALWTRSAALFRAAVLREVADPAAQRQLFDRFAAETISGEGRAVRDCPTAVWSAWIEAATHEAGGDS